MMLPSYPTAKVCIAGNPRVSMYVRMYACNLAEDAVCFALVHRFFACANDTQTKKDRRHKHAQASIYFRHLTP